MTIIATKFERSDDDIVPVMLNGERVTSSFRQALFTAAADANLSVNQFVLTSAAEKLRACGLQFSGCFKPGDLKSINIQKGANL